MAKCARVGSEQYWAKSRYILALIDCTIFPANATLLKNVIACAGLLLAMGPHVCGHLALPVPHTNTTCDAVLKHKRLIEDWILQQKVDLSQEVALHFSKDQHGNDRRRGIQTCFSLMCDVRRNLWSAPEVVGPLPRMKIGEMMGYDPDSRPGVAARTEQRLGICWVELAGIPLVRKGLAAHVATLDAYMEGLTLQTDDRVLVVDVLPNRLVIVCLFKCL